MKFSINSLTRIYRIKLVRCGGNIYYKETKELFLIAKGFKTGFYKIVMEYDIYYYFGETIFVTKQFKRQSFEFNASLNYRLLSILFWCIDNIKYILFEVKMKTKSLLKSTCVPFIISCDQRYFIENSIPSNISDHLSRFSLCKKNLSNFRPYLLRIFRHSVFV